MSGTNGISIDVSTNTYDDSVCEDITIYVPVDFMHHDDSMSVTLPPVSIEYGGEKRHMLSTYKALIFDVDGTLRTCTTGDMPCHPNAPGEWKIKDGVLRCLNKLTWKPNCFMASNQGGVAFSYLSHDMALRLLSDLRDELVLHTKLGPWAFTFCPHHPDGTDPEFARGCVCRKPAPGMFCEIMKKYSLAPQDVLVVGDMTTDQYAAVRAGCDFMYTSEFFRELDAL